MKKKHWSLTLIITTAVVLLAFGAATYILDPLARYRIATKPLTYYEYSTAYCNPGLARYSKYDSVLVGDCLIQNTDIDLFEKKLDSGKTLRLSTNGATTCDIKRILDCCFNNSVNNDIKNVYWELNESEIVYGTPDNTEYPLPEYMWNEDHYSDLSYLLNLDVLYHYTIKDIIHTIKGDRQPMAPRGITWGGDFDEEKVINEYNRPEEKTLSEKEEKELHLKTDGNIENVVEIVRNNSDTNFTFYIPPYSILYWDKAKRNGELEVELTGMEKAVGQLLEYDNVTVYFYQDIPEIFEDLDNYKDAIHFGNWVNDKLTELIGNNEGVLTLDNYQAKFRGFYNYLNEYDYDGLLSR